MRLAALLSPLDVTARWLTILMPALLIAGPAPGDIAASLIAVLFLGRSAIARDWTWLHVRWVQLLLVLWGYFTLRHVLLPGMGEIARAAVWVRYPLFGAALAFWVLPDIRTQQRLRISLIAAVAFLGLDTLYQYFMGVDITGRLPTLNNNSLRMTGPFSAPRVGITILWLMFPAALVMLGHPARRWRVAGMALAAIASVAVLVSGERMALLLMLMGWTASFLLLPRARLPLALMAAVGVLAGVAMMQNNPDLKHRQVGETSHGISNFWDTVYGRMWKASAQITVNHPLIGVGSKQFQPECRKPAYGPTDEESLTYRCPMHPHNIYAEWAVEGGLIALGLYVATIATWLGLAWRTRRIWWRNALATGLLITMALRLFPASVTPSQFVSWSAAPFWLVAGWLLAILVAAEKTSKSA